MRYKRTIKIEHYLDSDTEFNALLKSDNRLNSMLDRLAPEERMEIKKSKVEKLKF